MSNPCLHVLMSMAVFAAMTTHASVAEAASSHPCATIVDPGARLACYDAAFPPSADARPALSPEARRQKALQDFGLSNVQVRSREPEHLREISPDRIDGTIASVSHKATGERVVTLDNGQVWLLTEVTSKGQLKRGDRVVIRRASLGSFMLETPARIPLRARRTN